jgi:hypothetical protein
MLKMEMSDLKPFDPNDIDETLTRVVVHAGKTHLLFPFVNGVGTEPQYRSIGMVIAGPAATVEDFARLTSMIKHAGKDAVWRIVFNTPWLMRAGEEDAQRLLRRPRS